MMRAKEKIERLRAEIEKQLIPLIDSDYVLWDLPYHTNIGDTLIWQGEWNFLRKLPYKCLGYSSCNTCTFPKLSLDTIILLHGGGNFGDLWRDMQEFRLKVIERYPENRIIIFPQSVHYENIFLIKEDARKMAMHEKMVICARDLSSYNILRENFLNKILLLPDMAFCIDLDYLQKWSVDEKIKTLYVRRLDKEMGCELDKENFISNEIDIRDWPSLESPSLRINMYTRLISLQQKMREYKMSNRLIISLVDIMAFKKFRPLMIELGVRFISCYHLIYTTRLHVMILSVLLYKRVYFLDNSYGKNSSFYDTWLRDLDSVNPCK